MSLSGIPSALARAISPAALPARSDCAADALDCLESTAAEISARSGFLDTIASPLVITPGSNVDVVEDAEGAATRIEGLLTASTANVAVSAQSVAAAADNATVRIVDCILQTSCHANAAAHGWVTGACLDPGQPPEPPGRVDRVGGGQRHIEVVIAEHHVEHACWGPRRDRILDRQRRRPHCLPQDHPGPLDQVDVRRRK